MKRYIIVCFSFLMLVSCKTKHIVETPKPNTGKEKIKGDTNTQLYNAVLAKPTFAELKITSKIEARFGNPIPKLDATVYIENGEKIWMNISALFFNVARGIATPKGIKAYTKHNKSHIDSDFNYINNLLNVNFVDYQSLQNLLVGKSFVPIDEENFSVEKNANGFVLKSISGQKIVVDDKISEYLIEMNYSPEFNLTKVLLQDAKSKDNLEIQYFNWIEQQGQALPKNVKIIIKGKKTDEILIENTKFDFLRIDTPYSVPNNYQKIEK